MVAFPVAAGECPPPTLSLVSSSSRYLAPEPGAPWRTCTEYKRCHIAVACRNQNSLRHQSQSRSPSADRPRRQPRPLGNYHRADCGPYCRAGHSRLPGSRLGCFATNLNESKLPTACVVITKTLNRLPCSRQHHHIGAAGHHRTGTQQCRSSQQTTSTQQSHFSLHSIQRGGCGRTFCQPSGHSLT